MMVTGTRHLLPRAMWLLLLACVVVALTPHAAAADFSFGPDLNLATADNTATCAIAGATSGCTAFDAQTSSMFRYLPDPIVAGDQTGVVTTIRVRSAATAPAQFVVIEESAHQGVTGSIFPSGILAVSEQVTLHPGLNTFATNLPVDSRFSTSTGFSRWSVIGLNILNGTSPVPGWTTAPLINGSPTLSGETGLLLDCGSVFPCPSLLNMSPKPFTTALADITVAPHYASLSAFTPMRLLISGDVTVTTPAAGTPTPTPVTPTPTPVVVDPGAGVALQVKDQVRLGRAFTVGRAKNPPTAATRQTLTTRRAKAASAKTVVIARGTTKIASGRSAAMQVKLTRSGAKLVRAHKTLKVKLTVVATGTGGQTKTLTKTVTLVRR